MPYRITRHANDLLWVVMEGQISLDHADDYFHELWATLDACPAPTDLLVDGRRIGGASPSARRRTEQVAHHPHLGHLAFVVSEAHMLIFAPFVKLVSGIGLFGHEHEALDYLRAARGQPPLDDLALPTLPPPPASEVVSYAEPPPDPAASARAVGLPGRPLPPPPTSRVPVRLHRAAARQAAQHHAPPQPEQHHAAPQPEPARPAPAPPPPSVFGSLTNMVDGLTSGIRGVTKRIEREK